MATTAAAADLLPPLGPRKRGRPRKHPVAAESSGGVVLSPLAEPPGPRPRGRPRKYPVAAEVAPGSLFSPPAAAEAGGEYERERAARIRENLERMRSLGILDLAQTLTQSAAAAKAGRGRPRRMPGEAKPAARAPSRSLLRLKSMEPVRYFETKQKKEKHSDGGETELLEEGAKEEHEKLLGTCDTL